MIALHFDLVFDLLHSVGTASAKEQASQWAVLPLFILSLTSFVMGRSTTFMSAQYCADKFLKLPSLSA